MLEFFVTCSRGLEPLLMEEASSLGASELKERLGGIECRGELTLAYKLCLWSRVGSRVLLKLTQADAVDGDDVYNICSQIDWQQHFSNRSTFAVAFNGKSRAISNSQFGALKIKDAIVDHFNKTTGRRPDVSKSEPDVRVVGRLAKGSFSLYLDLSGEPLHRRGYRIGAGEAPLKENLAAAMAIRAGVEAGQTKAALDPCCGSGTLLIESALIVGGIAPGLLRQRFGFEGWAGHDNAAWRVVLEQAKAKEKAGRHHLVKQFFGHDIDDVVIKKARRNAQNAGLQDVIQFERRDLYRLENRFGKQGILLANPPYGERLGEFTELVLLHREVGRKLKQQFAGWQAAIFNADDELLSAIHLRADKRYRLYNGPIEGTLVKYSVSEQQQARVEQKAAPDFSNRLNKNFKRLKSWLKREEIQAYRLYDADLPEYNVAVDIYGDHTVVYEYAAPASIDPRKAQRRLQDILFALVDEGYANPTRLVLKRRQRQKGSQQYEKLRSRSVTTRIEEYGARFKVNLSDYVDTGVFLDHRVARRWLRQQAEGQRVLNLFCYTGTASVQAALGGAHTVTSVDMSNTYLRWAEENFRLNDLTAGRYSFQRGDCMAWLEDCQDTFDLAFVDPPSFSNSKRMDNIFDVQRDHVELLRRLAGVLADQATVYFSNNLRSFKLDQAKVESLGYRVENVTKASIPQDFARNSKIHQCWKLTRSQQ